VRDDKPDLTTTEVRQANSRKTNLRVLTISMIVVVIGLALAVWYNQSVSPETATTTGGGETIEDQAPADGTAAPTIDEAPQPMPVTPEETAPEPVAPEATEPTVTPEPAEEPAEVTAPEPEPAPVN